MGDEPGFAAAALEAVRLSPDDVSTNTLVHLAGALVNLRRGGEAVRLYTDILLPRQRNKDSHNNVSVPEVSPDGSRIAREALFRCNLAQLLVILGSDPDPVLAEASAEFPILHMSRAMFQIPIVPTSAVEMMHARRMTIAFTESAISRLRSGDMLPVPGTPGAFGDFAYHLCYNGMNDARIRQRLVELLQLSFSVLSNSIDYFALRMGSDDGPLISAASERPPQLRRQVHVCFVSSFFYQHSVGKMSLRLISQLTPLLYRKTVVRLRGNHDLTNAGEADAFSVAIDRAADDVVYLATMTQGSDHLLRYASSAAATSVIIR